MKTLKELKDYSVKEGITLYEAMKRTGHLEELKKRNPEGLDFLLNHMKEYKEKDEFCNICGKKINSKFLIGGNIFDRRDYKICFTISPFHFTLKRLGNSCNECEDKIQEGIEKLIDKLRKNK